ncbi:MAG: NUDIX hydrolase [Deltaproteobacteria bacterium]|nr:NUDIX hydrolase [Deltaproteobacteria bacterium]
MQDGWQEESSRTVFHHPVLSLRSVKRSLAGGPAAEFVVLACPDWVNIVAETPEGRVVLIRQFRHGSGARALEIPGGMVDPGETPAQAARRELREETGFEAGELVFLGKVNPNPALFNNTCHTFLAREAKPGGPASPEEHERIEVLTVPRGELLGLVRDGEIDHSLVVAALTFYWLAQGGIAAPPGGPGGA